MAITTPIFGNELLDSPEHTTEPGLQNTGRDLANQPIEHDRANHHLGSSPQHLRDLEQTSEQAGQLERVRTPASTYGIETLSPENEYWRPYLARLHDAIQGKWRPPSSSSIRRAIVFFTINRNGVPYDVRVLETSGVQNIDGSAVNAVRAAAPFGSFPSAFEGDTIDIQFTFDLTVATGE